ncbi:trypsin-like peptidase domain-containing protein [Bradyrhizobium sp. 173]|uniref:S1 family peptidase n=1 Tax=Bradyrhizobium sp. 173 TaxID=2782644 RepID=UPI001FFB4D0F|nr:serine protease [Bradyrhizobium sp. 173]MCK1564302.1 trypsin-like peptidase domain-containing protein [Bradyrhizobium sp. 173]
MSECSVQKWAPWLLDPLDRLIEQNTVEILDITGRKHLGTGSIISSYGTVMTCHHVVLGASKVRLVRHGEPRLEAEVSIDANTVSWTHDLALLESGWAGQSPLPLQADSDSSGTWRCNGYQDRQFGYHGFVLLSGSYHASNGRSYNAGSGTKKQYELEQALDLHGDAIHPGTSGAGLISKETAAIIGVVAASLTNQNDPYTSTGRSIAASLSQALGEWAPLLQINKDMAESVPRFGKTPSLLGASLVCRAQRLQTLTSLSEAGLFRAEHLRSRTFLKTYFEEFLKSPKQLMPIIGESGDGKSWIAFDLSLSSTLHCSVLLQGVHMQENDASIEVQIDRALHDEDFGTYGLSRLLRTDLPHTSPAALAKAAHDAGEPLLIILDGINERDERALPAHRIATAWMPRTITWLKRNNAKLIITSRPETWARLLPRELDDAIYPTAMNSEDARAATAQLGASDDSSRGIVRGPQGGLWVGQLRQEEATAFIETYDVKGKIDDVSARHPLFVRLAAELDLPVKLKSDEKIGVRFFDEALSRCFEQLLRRYPNISIGPTEIGLLVEEIAFSMLSADVASVPAIAASALPFSQSDALQALIDFGVFRRVGPDYRFSFDQFSDAVRSKFFTLPLTKRTQSLTCNFESPNLRSTFAMAASRMWDEVGFGIPLYAETVTSNGSVGLRAQLLIEIARLQEDGYGRRIKDWNDHQHYGDRFFDWVNTSHFGRALTHLYEKDSAAVTRLLLYHLDDRRRLIGGDNSEATVASLSGGALCAVAGERLVQFVPELFIIGTSEASAVLGTALRRHSSELAEAILEYAVSFKDDLPEYSQSIKILICELLSKAAKVHDRRGFRSEAIASIRPWTAAQQPPSSRSIAAATIQTIDATDIAAFNQLSEMLQPGANEETFIAGISQLHTIPSGHEREIVERVLDRLSVERGSARFGDFGPAWSSYNFLDRPDIRKGHASRILAFFERRVPEVPGEHRFIVEWMCHVLRDKVTDNIAKQRTYELLGLMIGNGIENVQIECVDHAFCNLPFGSNEAIEVQKVLGKYKLSDQALFWVARHSVMNSTDHPMEQCFQMAVQIRFADPEGWDTCMFRYISHLYGSEREEAFPFSERLVGYWVSLPNSELTRASRFVVMRRTRGDPFWDLFKPLVED